MDTEGPEQARLAAVGSYGLIDAPRPVVLDELTRLAATIFGTPMSSVTLVDHARQWFAGHTGMPGPHDPRHLSFCARMIDDPRPLIVRDARRHPVFRSWANVTGAPYIRFYAGVPLVDEDGYVLGGVCVVDTRPRTVPAERLDLLKALAGQAAGQLRAIRGARLLHDVGAELSRTLDREEDLVAAVSHELRTPVTTMQGYLELLSEEPDLEPYKAMLDPIRRNGQRLIRMVDHLLAGTRAPEAATILNRAPVDLREVAGRAAAACQAAAAQRNCRVNVESEPGSPAADGDIGKLTDAVEQLLRNAIAFSPQGARITVRAGFDERPYVRVDDDGVGIPEDELPYVQGRFYRGRFAREQAVSGMGLGLGIARRIAVAHGGDLSVLSPGHSGSGTSAVLAVPAAQVRPVPAERIVRPVGTNLGGDLDTVRGR